MVVVAELLGPSNRGMRDCKFDAAYAALSLPSLPSANGVFELEFL